MGMVRLVRRVFTGTTTWTAPSGVKYIFATGCGGGGGGGAGNVGGTNACGGAGGGAAQETTLPLIVVPNTVYDIVIGAGGLGGVAGGGYPGNSGQNGGDSRVMPVGGDSSTELVCWPGAQGGAGGGTAGSTLGGITVRDLTGNFNAASNTNEFKHNANHTKSGQGGYGYQRDVNINSKFGYRCGQGAGGVAGLHGTFTAGGFGFNAGGGGGGGAGGSAWGSNGGAGGAGGNSASPGGSAGSAGSAGQGFGSGGGGGGGGGWNNSTGSQFIAGVGGTGAPGRIILFWWE